MNRRSILRLIGLAPVAAPAAIAAATRTGAEGSVSTAFGGRAATLTSLSARAWDDLAVASQIGTLQSGPVLGQGRALEGLATRVVGIERQISDAARHLSSIEGSHPKLTSSPMVITHG